MPSRTEVFKLYREFLRQSKKVSDYNIRYYALRRSKEGFRDARNQAVEESNKSFAQGFKELEVLKRHVVISSLYVEPTSVMVNQPKI